MVPRNARGRELKSSPSIRAVFDETLADDSLLGQELATGEAAVVVVFDVDAGLAVCNVLGQQPADDGAHHEAVARVAVGLEEARDLVDGTENRVSIGRDDVVAGPLTHEFDAGKARHLSLIHISEPTRPY